MRRMVSIGAMAVAAILSCAALAQANEIQQLAQKLAGNDEAARCEARQLLPRFGAEALEAVVPLMQSENPAVFKAAYQVVEDIANESAGPGREADRKAVVCALMPLLSAERPAAVRLRALQILPFVIREGDDIAPIVALLSDSDADLREKGRITLESAGTHAAAKALLGAVKGADAKFASALLQSLGEMRDAACLPEIAGIAASHADPGVRAAGAMALAWTGDPDLAPVLKKIRATATPETEVLATTAVLRLAEAMAKNGGNWNAAIALFNEVLATAQRPTLKANALMGLGRFGDETVVEVIVAASAATEPEVQAAIVPALASLRGKAAITHIVAVYPQCNPSIKPALLAMFGARRDALFLPVLKQEAAGADPALRSAALQALAESGLPDALAPLIAAAQAGTDQEKQMALAGAKRIAGGLGDAGDKAAAGKAFLDLYGMAQTDDLRIMALEGLARYPVVEAHDVVMAALGQEALKASAQKVVPELFAPLAVAGQDDKALAVYALATQLDPSPDARVRLAGRLQGIQTKIDTCKLLGVINYWHVVGPFPWKSDADWETAFVGEPAVDLAAAYKVGDKELRWKDVTTADASGFVDLCAQVAQVERSFAYAYVEIESAEAQAAQVRLGSDDGNALWVNGARVHLNNCDRGAMMDQDVVDVQLAAGVNRLLVKISQGGGGWVFCARITKQDGSAAPFTIKRP